MIKEIKELHKQVLDKNTLAEKLSEKFFVQISTIKNHWFSGSWAIPRKYQKSVLEIIKDHIKSQINIQSELLSSISKK